MDTFNRLQFRYHDEIFETREDALKYICKTLPTEGGEELAVQGSPYTRSLIAEPTILRYKNEEEDSSCEGCSKGPHLILVIGSETNDDSYSINKNKYCVIDIDKTEEEIKDLEEELAKAVKSLTLAVLDTDTLDLHVKKTEDGTFLSGDVKTAKTHVFDNVVKENNLAIFSETEKGPEGLFIYVGLTYDEQSETFTFTVSQADGTLKNTAVKLPNNYLVSGEYKKSDESLHLYMRNGDEVIVDCEELIAEWNVEGEASKTPIVLTREEVDYDGTDEHHHVEPWQDVLRADVRIADDRPANILKKTVDGRYLYVDGVASNIVYYWNGDRSNVKEQLDKLNKIKISKDNDNIIWERADGYFASTNLDYISSENKLVLTTSSVNGTPIKHEVQLNTVDVIESIVYDPTREELVIKYKNDKGETKTVRVPISAMIDEWDVLNTAHSVKLVRQRKTSGKDILTADVNISSLEDNILEEKSEQGLHTLYVKGTASNIKYGNGTVKDALDDLIEEDENINKRIDDEIVRATTAEEALDEKINQEIDDRTADVERIDTTIGSGFSIDAHETVTYKFEQLQNQVNSEAEKLQNEIDRSTSADTVHDGRLDTIETEIGDGFGPRFTIEDAVNELSADTRASLKHVVNEDESIDVVERDGSDGKEAVVKVNLSTEVEDDRKNIIKLNSDGLFANVDLSYIEEANKLIFHTSNGEPDKEIQLESMSSIISIEYSPSKEAIVITYMTNGHEIKVVEIPVGDLINEWRVEDGHPHAVELEKIRISSGTTEQDILKASVIITVDHDDNILTMDDGALYVPANTDVTAALSGAIRTESERAISAETELNNKIEAETIRAISAETALSGEIRTVKTDLQNEIQRSTSADTRIEAKLDTEIERSVAEDLRLSQLIQDESIRALSAETALSGEIRTVKTDLQNEVQRATSTENRIETKLDTEISRATSEDQRLYQLIQDEAIRATYADEVLDGKINDETVARTEADATLRIAINDESAARNAKDTIIETKLDTEIERATSEDERLSIEITTEKERAQAAEAQLAQDIANATLTFEDSHSIDFTTSGTNVTASVKLANSPDNIILTGDTASGKYGVYASVDFDYIPATNKIKFTVNGNEKEFTIAAGSILEDAWYDPVTKELVFKTKTSDGSYVEVKVPAYDLFDDWNVVNPPENSAIELTKVTGRTDPTTHEPLPDELSGRVLISPLEDNMLIMDTNGLYVPGSGSTIAECADKKVNAIYKLLYGQGAGIQGCGEDTKYVRDTGCIISAATSFEEADKLLNDAVCELIDKWYIYGFDTPSTHTDWKIIGQNQHMLVDARLSHGINAYGDGMTDDELLIKDYNDEFIEPGLSAFSDTNVIRIVDISKAKSGEPLEPDNKYNGIYLSNIWDCGLYYGPSDTEAKAAAEAAGYNTNYSTDESSDAYNYNYMNNVRQRDIPSQG